MDAPPYLPPRPMKLEGGGQVLQFQPSIDILVNKFECRVIGNIVVV